MSSEQIRLTQYSHGAGCGCKISPKVLSSILSSQLPSFTDPNLIVGNETRDDASVFKLNDTTGIISTTDFFMPIVDDPFTFGRIAATNAISDIYAMGGQPIMAIAILGWPVNTLAPEVASQVIDGGRYACQEAGIALAGGHSIDAPEPIFGLAVTGQVPLKHLKQNSTAQAGDKLYLTKPIGIGIHTTAQKKGLLAKEDANMAIDAMCQLNTIGNHIAKLDGVHAMTDVTGFGLGGHLTEMCQGADLSAILHFDSIPVLSQTHKYLELGCIPGGCERNFDSYGQHLPKLTDTEKAMLCDPQTSGGLLIAVSPDTEQALLELFEQYQQFATCIGEMTSAPSAPLIQLKGNQR
ncbi:selenide, water dikinase SelD [Parashewanella tropica]|uniref:selenide, water dikinase SelD n=1 Tax=Parashewanella tropica TaxID=2547970 RepID=UPI00105A69B9|nr:selenide, water dikinase SelD [Parashewanella tropica]